MPVLLKAVKLLGMAMSALSDEENLKKILRLITVIISPIIVVVLVIMCFLSASSDHNCSAVDTVFHGGDLPLSMSLEYRNEIENMQSCFSSLDSAIVSVQSSLDEGTLDAVHIKAMFYSLFFGVERPSSGSLFSDFAECFTGYEERTRTVTDEDGNSYEEAYIVKIALSSTEEMWSNISLLINKPITFEQKSNALAIENQARFGGGTPDMKGISQEEWTALVLAEGSVSAEGYASPLGDSWRAMVTSEFGWRSDPFGSGKGEGHGGIDLGAAKGTPVKAAKDGTVCYVRTSLGSSYGYYLIIDHGNDMKTLYAHCSKIMVKTGEYVSQGEVIAAVGSTGRSTGNHLHFEVRCGNLKVNPREILP